ncbi:transglycosylase SLT domain-containing protein [candidate division KSB1 bacterium]|nr:transglycosylase SLT domain-containing protein [candidate division KSB1 bacterium]
MNLVLHNFKKILMIMTLHISVFSLVIAGVVYFDKTHSTLTDIEEKVYLSEKINSIDSTRISSIERIVQIISKYNPEMEAGLKQDIANEIYLMSQKYTNLNINFICATITHESARSWKPQVISNAGAMGLMQVMPTTGAFLAAEEGISFTSKEILYDPIINIRLGCRYLSQLVAMYEHDGGLAAYNGGPYRAEMWIESNKNYNILFAETRDYVPAVLELYQQFRSEQVM